MGKGRGEVKSPQAIAEGAHTTKGAYQEAADAELAAAAIARKRSSKNEQAGAPHGHDTPQADGKRNAKEDREIRKSFIAEGSASAQSYTP